MKSDDTTLFPGGESPFRATVGFSPEADGTAPASVGAEAVNFKDMSTPALAYLGDCVLELFVRDALVRAGLSSAKTLNARAMDFVRAPVQAAAVHRILPLLSEEEAGFFRRGRNLGHTGTPKGATVGEYRAATGFEALFGFLHLSGNEERAKALFALAYADELARLSHTPS